MQRREFFTAGLALAVGAAGGDLAATASAHSSTPAQFDGLVVSDASSKRDDHAFLLGPRTTDGLSFPVPTVQPKADGMPCAFDVAPSAHASPSPKDGFAWVDVCSAPIMDATVEGVATTRIAIQDGFGEVSTRAYDGARPMPLYIGAGYPGEGRPQIECSPMGRESTVMLGRDGADVIAGAGTPLEPTARRGFFSLPTCEGAPVGTPRNQSQAPLIYDRVHNRIYAYNDGWRAVALS